MVDRDTPGTGHRTRSDGFSGLSASVGRIQYQHRRIPGLSRRIQRDDVVADATPQDIPSGRFLALRSRAPRHRRFRTVYWSLRSTSHAAGRVRERPDGLTSSYDNGQPSLDFIATGRDLAFVLDVRVDRPPARQRGLSWTRQQAAAGDRAAVVVVKQSIRLPQTFTDDRGQVFAAVDALRAQGSTALYDGLYTSLRAFEAERRSVRIRDGRRSSCCPMASTTRVM